MKILWIKCKRFDKDMDRATWVEMVKAIINKGDKPVLIVPRMKNKLNIPRDNVKYIQRMQWRILYSISFSSFLFLYLLFTVLPNPPNAVILDEITFFFLFPFIILSKTKFIKTKFVLDIRSVPVEIHSATAHIKEQIYKLVLSISKIFLEGITVISPLMKKQICDEYSIDEDRVGIWSSGVSVETFSVSDVKRIDTFPFNNKYFIVMYHGVLSKSRGLQETVKAIKLLEDRHRDIVFFILGDGDARKELESLIKNLKLEGKVFLHNPVPNEEVPQYIAACDVGIIPLPNLVWWKVSSSLKLIEYLAMGKPVIVTDIEAHRNVIGDLPCGIFIKSSEPEEIAKGIEKAYNLRKKLKEMGRTRRELVTNKYTWEKQAENLLNFLKNL